MKPKPVWTGAENLAPTGIRSPEPLCRPNFIPSLVLSLYFPARVCVSNVLASSFVFIVNTHDTNIHDPASERPHTHALDHASTGMGGAVG